MLLWLAIPLLLALVLASAKTHGRQIRLEREQKGIWKVDFRADNGPVVEAIWRRDRRIFWTAFTIAFALLGGFVLIAALELWQLWGGLAFAAVFALCLAFVVAGLASAARLIAANRREGSPSPEWWRAGHRGSALWWGLVAVLLAFVVASVFLNF